jgi:hypothetical protein
MAPPDHCLPSNLPESPKFSRTLLAPAATLVLFRSGQEKCHRWHFSCPKRLRTVHQELSDRASRQYGAFTAGQAYANGLSRSTLHRWVREGRLLTLHPGVHAFAGSTPSWERSLMAAVLAAGPGAVVSHRSGAHLWELLEDETIVRQNGLVPYCWRVLRFTWAQVVRQPEYVAATIGRTLAALAA